MTKRLRYNPYKDKIESKIWGRARKYFIRDKPYYYDIIPEPLVNFDLNFQDE